MGTALLRWQLEDLQMGEIATCWYPGGHKTGLAKCWAQCLACGKYSVHEGVTFPHTPYPTPTGPSLLPSLLPVTCRPEDPVFHLPFPHTIPTCHRCVWVRAGDKRRPGNDRSFPQLAQEAQPSHSNRKVTATKALNSMALSSLSPSDAASGLPGMSAISRQTSFGIIRPKCLAHVRPGTRGLGKHSK